MKRILFFALLFLTFRAGAQVLTREDSLNAGLVRSDRTTVISSYGEAGVTYDLVNKTGEASLRRNVLFLGHRFSNKIYLFSELEIENALVEGGEEHGEISMEQLFIRFSLSRDIYLTAGLFIPRIGLINENHLPVTFNGYDRPFTEQLVIPTVWRELGVGLWGRSRRNPAFNYSFALVNGLNSAGFSNAEGIREGRYEGSLASASNLAVTGSVLYYAGNFRLQASAYYGGSAGLDPRTADSLELKSGAFGTPVAVEEVNAKFNNGVVSFTALGAAVQIPDAAAINRAYVSNVAQMIIGGYGEAALNIFKIANIRQTDSTHRQNLWVFARYEYMNLNQQLASNGIENDILRKQFIVAGISYFPIPGVVVKADYVMRSTGLPNEALLVNPFPQGRPYATENGFVNIGIGYSF